MNKAYILTGGNVGNSATYLKQAIALLNESCGNVVQSSGLYQTAAWGKTDQAAFLNQALLLQTSLDAVSLMKALLLVEEKMGRKRLEKYGPRIIDLDILLFNEEIYHTSLITIPHPELANRRFALVPLAEIAGNIIHPILKKSIATLLNDCPDYSDVKKLG